MSISDSDLRIATVPKIGRPKKFETVEDLQQMIEDYFDSCFMPKTYERRFVTYDEDGKEIANYETSPCLDRKGNPIFYQIRPFTISGLAVALDTTRDVLLDYENKVENAAFSNTIKKAKQIIHNYAEEFLFNGKNSTGAIFNLKNNWGYVDRTETDITSKNKSIAPEAAQAKAADILGRKPVEEIIEPETNAN